MRSHVPFGSDFQVNVLLARPSHFTRQAQLPRSVNNLMLLPISYGAFGLLGNPGNVALQTLGIVGLQLPAGRLMIGQGDVDGVFVVVFLAGFPFAFGRPFAFPFGFALAVLVMTACTCSAMDSIECGSTSAPIVFEDAVSLCPRCSHVV